MACAETQSAVLLAHCRRRHQQLQQGSRRHLGGTAVALQLEVSCTQPAVAHGDAHGLAHTVLSLLPGGLGARSLHMPAVIVASWLSWASPLSGLKAWQMPALAASAALQKRPMQACAMPVHIASIVAQLQRQCSAAFGPPSAVTSWGICSKTLKPVHCLAYRFCYSCTTWYQLLTMPTKASLTRAAMAGRRHAWCTSQACAAQVQGQCRAGFGLSNANTTWGHLSNTLKPVYCLAYGWC